MREALMLLSGYWKEPEKLAAAMKGEFFSAGDMGYKDEDGYLFLVDRKANMIISGGENIYPSEVENCVGGNPKVKDVAVIGVPHEKWGESVMAFVVLHEGQTATAEEITGYCKGKIAGFKVPKNCYLYQRRRDAENSYRQDPPQGPEREIRDVGGS